MELTPVLKEIKQFKEKPDATGQRWSRDRRTRPHPAKLPTCEKELKKSLEPDVMLQCL